MIENVTPEEEETHEENEEKNESDVSLYEDTEEIREDDQNTNDTPRRSGRTRKFPSKYDNFVFLTYHEAITGPEKSKWMSAIEEEKQSLLKNDTWTVVETEEAGKIKPLSSRWIFKVKDDGRYKARLVIRGCEQRAGIDYEETFSPVVSTTALRTLFALIANESYCFITLDIKTAFLYGSLEEVIYMYPPEGYGYKNKLCKLNKALYGLKQASLKWNERFSSFLKEKGLEPLKSEQCIFKRNGSNLTMAIYVDDGIIIGNDETEMEILLNELRREFQMNVTRNPTTFVGMEIHNTENGIKLMQSDYSTKLLHKFKMEDSKSMYTPAIKDDRLQDDESKEKKCILYPCREAIGSLLYISNKTRPDLSYAVGKASRYVGKPINKDVISIKRMFRYLKGTQRIGIEFNSNENKTEVFAYSDSDFAGDGESRRSTTGYVITYCNGAISWCSRRQQTVALSSTEAEYIAASECCKELLYVKTLIKELTGVAPRIKLYIDNQSTISLIKNGVINKRSKHIDVKYRFIHEMYKDKIIDIQYCPTDSQIADIFTKPLERLKFNELKTRIVR